MRAGRGWYSRGYLPHVDVAGATQFLTWRLADALPAQVIERLNREANNLDEDKRKGEISRNIERYCDAGHGECLLARSAISRCVQESFFAEHGVSWTLHRWVIMPNHVHLIVSPNEETSLADLVKRMKGSSSRTINRILGRSGRLWQPGYFDKVIRNADHFDRVRKYIEWNPVKAKLCPDPKLWPWSSANADAQHRLTYLETQRLGQRAEARDTWAE